ncbi:MAG: phosphoesterase [Acidobacteriota bacterium]|nr:phosphoesterase [Acidobacteriota bacterium]
MLMLGVAPVLAEDGYGHEGHAIRHVFVIVLENEGYTTTFGPGSKAPYLSQTLPAQGVLLTQYYGTGHVSLDNYISMISGQAGTLANHADCTTYSDFVATGAGVTADGQAIGNGCVYPASIKTLPDQLKEVGKSWRGYMEDMGNDPSRESATCGHPALNTADLTQAAEKPSASVPQGDQYASRHNPFVYFHSILDSGDCGHNVVNLNQLQADLSSERSTPNLVYITPNLCNDGHDAPCVTGAPGGLVSADAFLQKWVPIITASEAYKEDGLLIITFDEGGYTVGKSSSGGITITFPGQLCCSEQPGPNAATFPQTSTIGPYTLVYGNYGGDRTGAVLLSPFLKPGTVSNTPFNHYSMLKTLEDIFETKGYLGYAGAPGLEGFFGCVNSDLQTTTHDQFGSCHRD